MDGMDTADDGFIQTQERNVLEQGSESYIKLESNQEKLERNIRFARYMDWE
jgi:hypothetical protein